jgi:hypothetical protein
MSWFEFEMILTRIRAVLASLLMLVQIVLVFLKLRKPIEIERPEPVAIVPRQSNDTGQLTAFLWGFGLACVVLLLAYINLRPQLREG